MVAQDDQIPQEVRNIRAGEPLYESQKESRIETISAAERRTGPTPTAVHFDEIACSEQAFGTDVRRRRSLVSPFVETNKLENGYILSIWQAPRWRIGRLFLAIRSRIRKRKRRSARLH